jgi:hypothetical protein
MALPVKTTSDDVRGIVKYLKTKPTGATVPQAKAAVNKKLVDPRKMSAYQAWGVVQREGDTYKLANLGRALAQKPEAEQAVFRQILDGDPAYRSILEWMHHQELKNPSALDVAAYLHEHHKVIVGDKVKDATIRENAVASFSLPRRPVSVEPFLGAEAIRLGSR